MDTKVLDVKDNATILFHILLSYQSSKSIIHYLRN